MKKLYEKPSMKVFNLSQEPEVLVGSITTTVAGSRYGYYYEGDGDN